MAPAREKQQDIAEIVRELVTLTGWTQAEIAQALGVDQGTVSRWTRQGAPIAQSNRTSLLAILRAERIKRGLSVEGGTEARPLLVLKVEELLKLDREALIGQAKVGEYVEMLTRMIDLALKQTMPVRYSKKGALRGRNLLLDHIEGQHGKVDTGITVPDESELPHLSPKKEKG